MLASKESLIACSKCSTRVPLNDLKADKEGRKWVCTSCYSLQHPMHQKLRQPEKEFNNFKVESQNKKFKYQCASCKYSFTRNKEFQGMCPYCSKLGTVEKFIL